MLQAYLDVALFRGEIPGVIHQLVEHLHQHFRVAQQGAAIGRSLIVNPVPVIQLLVGSTGLAGDLGQVKGSLSAWSKLCSSRAASLMLVRMRRRRSVAAEARSRYSRRSVSDWLWARFSSEERTTATGVFSSWDSRREKLSRYRL